MGNEYQNVTIEMAIFVDSSLYQALKKTFPDSTNDHVVNVVTAMMNAVQILFDDEALGHKVTLVVKRLEVLKDQNPKDLPSNENIEKMLDEFCKVILFFLRCKVTT